jgi:predicted RNA-binding Zn ribbon-like protein
MTHMVSAAGELDLRGGHQVVDFVNTVAWRGDSSRRTDYLAQYSDVVAWCRHAAVVNAAEADALAHLARRDGAATRRALERTLRLRESLHSLWTRPTPSMLKTIGQAYADVLSGSELRVTDDHVYWAERRITLDTPLSRLATAAVALLTDTPLSRVKQCGDAACGWMFVDSSHRRNRRWCSAADCGNRDRARRHYERSRTR